MYLSNSFGPKQRHNVSVGNYAGWLVSPSTRGIPSGVQNGEAWAADNNCFSASFTDDSFLHFLDRMRPYSATCLFVVVPDALGDWRKTLDLFYRWVDRIVGYPLAFVGQDGITSDKIPWGGFSTYFVGGTDEWKDSAQSMSLVSDARRRGCRVHVGRCNTRPRLAAFIKAYKLRGDGVVLPGFTFDGNGMRFPGKERELAPAMALLNTEFLI